MYQDDVAEAVKNYYQDGLRRGKRGEKITQELIANNQNLLSDRDDAPVFWFALADTQWNLGRLEESAKAQALSYIRNGSDLERWKTEDPQSAKARAEVLSGLERKLLTPQSAEKKISQYRLYHCEWKTGDVFSYPLNSDYAREKGICGRYFLFQKIGETTWHLGHIVPIVRVKITEDNKIPTDAEEFDKLEYVQISATKYEDRFLPIDGTRPEEDIAEKSKLKYEVDECGFLPQYRLVLVNTSKRIIPSEVAFVGNFPDAKPPEKEFVPHSERSISAFAWKFFGKAMIDRYCGYNLRQFENYSKRNQVI